MNIKWIVTLTILLITENDGVSGKDVRVKLCGREFIRMVVTLCGSSRLRRYAPEIDPVSISPHGGFLIFYGKVCKLNFSVEYRGSKIWRFHSLQFKFIFYSRNSVQQWSVFQSDTNEEQKWRSANRQLSRESVELIIIIVSQDHGVSRTFELQAEAWCRPCRSVLQIRMHQDWAGSILLSINTQHYWI